MPDYTTFQSTRTTTAPAAYLVPESEGETIERLRAHGIRTLALEAAESLEVEVFTADSVQTSEREYQRRKPTALFGSWSSETRELSAGTVVVPTDQPLGRLAALLLEPLSDDGLAAWAVLEVGEDRVWPVVRANRVPGGE
jgi:hypothetical protein